MFLGSECRNEFNSHLPVRISDMKIFHKLDVHNFLSARLKFFMKSFLLFLTAISLSNGEMRIFPELNVHHV